MATRLIFGCGYIGHRVASRWQAAGDRVFVATRKADNAERFRAEGFEPIVADVTCPATLSDLPEVDTLLFAVGFDRGAGPSIQEVYADGFANVLAALSDRVQRVVYLSTTGVYGNADGEWVDEQTPPAPARDGGKASLAAEQVLAESPFADRGVALRLAGIYGPGRIPYVDKLKAGEPIAAPQTGWLNLIHADDAASAAIVAADHPDPPATVCVSDGAPPQRSDYYGEVARLIGASGPAFVDPPLGSPKAARAAADKRIRNRVLSERLGVELQFPTYREGLAQALQ